MKYRPEFLYVNFQFNGAMVRAEDIGVDFCLLYFIFNAVSNAEIVNTPACVVGSCVEAIAPPGIDAFSVGIKISEGICETAFKKQRKLSSFLIGEACIRTNFCRFMPRAVGNTGQYHRWSTWLSAISLQAQVLTFHWPGQTAWHMFGFHEHSCAIPFAHPSPRDRLLHLYTGAYLDLDTIASCLRYQWA